jgi:hypothetical protein
MGIFLTLMFFTYVGLLPILVFQINSEQKKNLTYLLAFVLDCDFLPIFQSLHCNFQKRNLLIPLDIQLTICSN